MLPVFRTSSAFTPCRVPAHSIGRVSGSKFAFGTYACRVAHQSLRLRQTAMPNPGVCDEGPDHLTAAAHTRLSLADYLQFKNEVTAGTAVMVTTGLDYTQGLAMWISLRLQGCRKGQVVTLDCQSSRDIG